jgi:hypothetical protein
MELILEGKRLMYAMYRNTVVVHLTVPNKKVTDGNRLVVYIYVYVHC